MFQIFFFFSSSHQVSASSSGLEGLIQSGSFDLNSTLESGVYSRSVSTVCWLDFFFFLATFCNIDAALTGYVCYLCVGSFCPLNILAYVPAADKPSHHWNTEREWLIKICIFWYPVQHYIKKKKNEWKHVNLGIGEAKNQK